MGHNLLYSLLKFQAFFCCQNVSGQVKIKNKRIACIGLHYCVKCLWCQCTKHSMVTALTVVQLCVSDILLVDLQKFFNFRFSPVMWSKLKIITIHWIKSRIWDMIDDRYINNITKNQVFAVFHSHVICRSESPKFIELFYGTTMLVTFWGAQMWWL